MSDGFVDEKSGSFSLNKLREDEQALDENASLIDTTTDVDYKETFNIIRRAVVFIRFYWRRYVAHLSMEYTGIVVGIAVAPWAGKVLIDNVVLGQPLAENGEGYPPFLLPVLDFLQGSSAGTIMYWLAAWTIGGVVIMWIWTYVHTLIETRLSDAMLHMVRSRLFESLRSLPITQLDDQPIGDSVARTMEDASSISEIIRRVVETPGYAVVAFTTALLTLLSAYPDLSLIHI